MTINISTEAQLRSFISNFYLGGDPDANLLNDINITGGGVKQLGDGTRTYNGFFNGNGFKITNYTNLNTGSAEQGFFGIIGSGGTATNLTVEGTITGGASVGGIVGWCIGQLNFCTFKGTVIGTQYTGGVVGRFTGVHAHTLSFDGDVQGTNTVGGVIGSVSTGSGYTNYLYSTGTVTGTSDYIGGCIGRVSEYSGVLAYLSSKSDVSGGGNVGGCIGQVFVAIPVQQVISEGVVTASSTPIGGLIGSKTTATVTNSYYNSTTSGRSDNDGRGIPLTSAQWLVEGNFTGVSFTNTWIMTPTGPELQKFYEIPLVPSTQPTTLSFHATRTGDITPTLTFTGGPIEVFTETSQVGPVTNYTSQGTFVSGTPKTISLTLGQRLYFTIPAGTSITAMDFTDDQITGTLDSEAIQIFAEITLTNSGWRRYYIEKTLEYLNTAGFTGTLNAQTGLTGIFTDESLTARTALIAGGATINVNLAQKGAGTYNFTLSFTTTDANQDYGTTITGVTGVTVNIKNSGGTIIHTLNTGTIEQPIAVAGDYTAEWEVTYDGTADTTLFFNTGTSQIHSFDVSDIPIQILSNSTNTNITLNGVITSDLSDFSENTKAAARLSIMGNYGTTLARIVGDLGALVKPTFSGFEIQYAPYIYGDISSIAKPSLGNFSFRGQDRIIGDVDALKETIGVAGIMLCNGLTGSIQNWKGYLQNITGSTGIQGPLNTVTTPYHTTFYVSGSGITKAQLEQSITELYNNRFATFYGAIIARGYGTEVVIDDPAIVLMFQEFDAKNPVWDIKTLLPPTTFYTNFNAAVDDVFNVNIQPASAYGNFKVTFPVGAFKRTSDNAPITEWTANTNPIVTCTAAGNHEIKFELSYDGQTATTQFSIGGGACAKHEFDVSALPVFVAKNGLNLTGCVNVIGDVSPFNDMTGILSLSNSGVAGQITGLTKSYALYLEGTDVSGPINNCLANASWQLRNTKLSRTDIEQSLIYLDNRAPLFTGKFIADTGMPGLLDPAAITAYNNLVTRLGAANIKATLDPMPVPSDEVTRIFCHATKAGDITPKFTFTGGPIEVFTETSQLGPTTLYTSQGFMASDVEMTIPLTVGQRLYFEIGIGVSITAMDFTGDQITGTLDSEAIYIEATINLSNSGWRRYYVEKTLEYLDSVGYAGVFHAKDGNIPGIFTDASLTARTNILARGTSVVNVNLAQKGAGTYNFTLPFRTDGVNKVFQITIARNNATYITSVTCVIKDSGGNTVHTLTPAAVSNTFVCNATIASIGEYTAEWSIVLNPTGLTTDTCSYLGTVGTVIHTFDIKDIPVGIAFTSLYNTFTYKTEIGGDISDFSEMIPGSRIAIHQFYPHFLPTLFGDITTLKVRYLLQLFRCDNTYGNIENIDWGMGGVVPYIIGFSENNKIVGDVDCLKDLNYPLNNSGKIGFVNCQGVHGSIQNWKSASVDIRGSSNIQGPINTNVSNYVVSSKQVYGSGFTLEQLEESIDRLYNCGFVYKGSFLARGTGYGSELATSNQTTIDQIASLVAGGANIQVKTVAAVYDFTLSYDGAEVGDVYWIAITPTTNFIDYKITFPAGAFVRADNGDPVTEWTENMSPNVRCVIAGDYDIRWQFGWDGMGATIFSMAGGPVGSRSKHTFDVSLIPDACHTRQANLHSATNVTGDISKFSNTSEVVAFYATQSLSGSIASLTQQTYISLDLRASSLGGVVSGGAANCDYQLDGSKLTKSDIAKSLIYLNNRDPLFTGNFWCTWKMPAVTDKKGIEAYDALVARLGDTKIRVNVDRDWVGTVPDLVKNRFNSSVFSRLSNLRRF